MGDGRLEIILHVETDDAACRVIIVCEFVGCAVDKLLYPSNVVVSGFQSAIPAYSIRRGGCKFWFSHSKGLQVKTAREEESPVKQNKIVAEMLQP